LNALIYAPSGGGKTVQVTRTPGKRNLLLCSDNSSVVLNQPKFKRDNLDIQTVSHWLPNDKYNKPQEHFHAQFETAVESKKYTNIFVDNLSDLFDLAILEMDESGRYKDMRQAYQSVYQAIKRLARKAGQLNCNVIFTAWANQQEIILPTGERGMRIEPKLPPKIIDNVLGLCNIVGYVTPNKERTEWFYITEGTPSLYAKNQITGESRVKPEEIWGK
jgi:phage nucleotide-binding protein